VKKIKISALILSLSLLSILLSSCQHSSPKSLARAYVLDCKAMNASGITSLYRHENDDEKKQFKEDLEESFEEIEDDAKTRLKSMTFKGYKKTSGENNEETGVLSFAYKENEKSEKTEKSVSLDFVKIKNRWYIKRPKNPETPTVKTAAKNAEILSENGGIVPRNLSAENAKNSFENFGENTKNFFENFGENTKNFFENFENKAENFFKDFGNNIKNFFENALNDTIESTKKVNSDIQKFFKHIGEKIKNLA
jgi:hypothetical protein